MQPPLPLSVAVLTRNEQHNLPRCLESVRGLAAELVVVDSGSTDRTAEIARAAGARFFVEPWPGIVAQRNHALARCTQPWVLCLDADEALSPELAQAIRGLFAAGEPAGAGFWINRRTWFLGQWIRHAWQPEWRLRLVRRAGARCAGRDPHDHLEAAGATQRLTGDLLHYSFRDLRDFLEKNLRYARVGAESLAADGQVCRWRHLVLWPLAAFLKPLVLKQGWRDGWRGWIIAAAAMFNVLAKYAFLLERRLAPEEKDIDK
jgi:glycosyltransferase involved in cell wall biosynthesis